PETSFIRLSIFNTLGQSIRTLVQTTKKPGNYVFEWNGLNDDGEEVAGGIYFYIIKTERFMHCRKLLLLR
ncbi:hypothetical protein JW964_16380, partial [candidate division KSB1 bacterium]|nr:hypothetical protein [candidate division KSB1 bacterium]